MARGGKNVSKVTSGEYRQCNVVRLKSKVPDGYVQVSNLDTGEVELMSYEEFERRENERITNINQSCNRD